MQNINHAAAELAGRRLVNSDGGRLSESLRPTTLDEAFAIQCEVSKILKEKSGEHISGWKCLLPPEGKCIVGPIYKSKIHSGSVCPVIALNEQAAIEPEFAFVFAKPLPPRNTPYTSEEVLAALDCVRLAFELIKSRYATPDECEFPELLADGLFNQGLFLGPKVDQPVPSQCALVLSVGGKETSIPGEHPNKNPFGPVVWLANFLSQHQMGIEAGQAIITGSYAGVLHVPFDELVQVQYGDVATISTEFKSI